MSEVEAVEVTQFKVQINYKSGLQTVGWFDKFQANTSAGELTGITWKESKGECNIIFMGLNNVESVVQLDTRTVVVDTQ